MGRQFALSSLKGVVSLNDSDLQSKETRLRIYSLLYPSGKFKRKPFTQLPKQQQFSIARDVLKEAKARFAQLQDTSQLRHTGNHFLERFRKHYIGALIRTGGDIRASQNEVFMLAIAFVEEQINHCERDTQQWVEWSEERNKVEAELKRTVFDPVEEFISNEKKGLNIELQRAA